MRHSLRSAPNQPLSAKDSSIPTAVQANYAEIDKLSEEKERLAERIVQLVARARTKLDCDLSKMLVLQGEPELATQPGFYYGATVRNPVAQLNESLRAAASLAELPATPSSASQGGPPQKSEFVFQLGIIPILCLTDEHVFLFHPCVVSFPNTPTPFVLTCVRANFLPHAPPWPSHPTFQHVVCDMAISVHCMSILQHACTS